MTFRRFKVGKLIRDHIPEIMRSKGILVHDRIMEHDEYIAELKTKLLEEAEEVKQALNIEELTEELADVLEVIQAFIKASGIPSEQIEKIRLEKRNSKGGFERKVYGSHIEMEESHPEFAYFLNKAEKYPLAPV